MRSFVNCLIVFALLGTSIVMQGCRNTFPNSASDKTPPVFSQAEVRLEGSKINYETGTIDLTKREVTVYHLDSAVTIRIIASANDSESGIASIAIESSLYWECSGGHRSPVVGKVINQPLDFKAAEAPQYNKKIIKIDAIANPIAQMGCKVSKQGDGPMNVHGIVRVVATNGKGLKSVSQKFIFDYANLGAY
jgi:hypothetical protein